MNNHEFIILYNGISDSKSYVGYANMAYREAMEEDRKHEIQQIMILPMSPQDLTSLTNSKGAVLAHKILEILTNNSDNIIYSN